MEDRNVVFQRLKPSCVDLSRAALALNGPSGDGNTVTTRLEKLNNELIAVVTRAPLDEKLADYVFFPLSQVLKASQRISIRTLELTFHCLDILIEKGWRSRVEPQLAAQIMILCTMMSDKNPKGLASSESTDELRASALQCLCHLFDTISSAKEAKHVLTSESNFPQLGQTISLVLDALVDSASPEVQDTAIHTLVSLINNVATRDIKAAFLPGIVSKLTKVLTPQTKHRRSPIVLTRALEVLQVLLADTLGAGETGVSHNEKGVAGDESKIIDGKWLENAAIQLKPAIASIVKLRDHSRYDVREALAQFCFAILKQCRKTLENCGSLALETVLLFSSKNANEATKFRLESLAHRDQSIRVLIQSTLFDWLKSLPTQMQSANEQVKIQRLQQITTAYGIIVSSGVETIAIDRVLADFLRDSIVVTLQLPRSAQQNVQRTTRIRTLDMTLFEGDKGRTVFSPALIEYRGQQEVLQAIGEIVKLSASSSSSSSVFSTSLARSLRESYGETQIATFWLLLHAVQTALDQDTTDALLELGSEPTAFTDYLEDIFAFSLSVLTGTTDDEVDPRLQSLALRTFALRARTSGEEFRFELVDALYPVLHTLATPNEGLQDDSMVTLNIFTSVCGYTSVKELIVNNVDYLTNSVALKLNAFDVSPQAPQVLLAMVRLAGPSLLPFLEDTVESIFAALRDYHGYPLLVELLFKVLSVVAEEGAKDSRLAVTDGTTKELVHAKTDDWKPATINGLLDLLRETREEEASNQASVNLEPHPGRPWMDDDSAQEHGEDDVSEIDVDLPADIEALPPAPKVYGLLLKISELTQHFLPSASASLRVSLLSLIKTSMPAIACHENSFLPLINTLWPEIVSRLDDTEPSVVASALDVIALFCENAGDFMRSRMLQLWPSLAEIYQRTMEHVVQTLRPAKAQRITSSGNDTGEVVSSIAILKQAIARMNSMPADYSDTATRLVWTALVHAITVAVQNVHLSPEHFDEALEMLEPVLEQPLVREALEGENNDAVWLARVRNGVVLIPPMPGIGMNASKQFAAVAG